MQKSMLDAAAQQLGLDVAARLRAIKKEFDIKCNREMGEVCGGASFSQVNNWLNDNNLPRVPEMISLCELTGITLDWLYRGHIGSMDPGLSIRLAKRIGKPKD